VSSGDVRTFSLESIGQGGAFLQRHPVPPVGTEVKIQFVVRRGPYLSISGKVIRHDSADCGFAVRFRMTDEEHERIVHALSERSSIARATMVMVRPSALSFRRFPTRPTSLPARESAATSAPFLPLQ